MEDEQLKEFTDPEKFREYGGKYDYYGTWLKTWHEKYESEKHEYKKYWKALHYTMWQKTGDNLKHKMGKNVQKHVDNKLDESFDAVEKALPKKIPEYIFDLAANSLFTPVKGKTNPYVVLIHNELPGITVEYKGFDAFKGEENGFEHQNFKEDEVTRHDLVHQHEYATVKVNARDTWGNQGVAGILRFHLYDATKTYHKVLHLYVENSKNFLWLFGEQMRTCALVTDYTSEWDKEGTGAAKFQDEENCSEEADLRWEQPDGNDDLSIFMRSYDYEDVNKETKDLYKIRYARVVLTRPGMKLPKHLADPLKKQSKKNKEESSKTKNKGSAAQKQRNGQAMRGQNNMGNKNQSRQQLLEQLLRQK